MAIETDGSVSKLPKFMTTATNAASKFINNLKTGDAGTTTYAKNLSAADLNKARSIFSAELLSEYDKTYGNKDGKLTADEYTAAYSAAMKDYMATTGALDLKTADLNTDGNIDDADKTYQDMDLDGDVDEDDQAAFDKINATAIDQQSATVSGNVDANHDGVISVEEMALIAKMKDGQDSTGEKPTFDGTFSSKANDEIETWLSSGKLDMTPYASDLKTNTTDANAFLDALKGTDSSKAIDKKVVTETPEKKVIVQKWGSEPEKGEKYANDCLSRIIANNYPEVKLYSKEYKEILNKILDSNDIKNPSHISKGAELILP